MPYSQIPGGYIILSRKIIESEIWDKPPLYLKIWIWLLEKAQHKEFGQLKRGQLYTNIEEIQKSVSWHVGFRKEKPTKDQIFQVIDWMRNTSNGKISRGGYESNDESNNESNTRATMITTMRATMRATQVILLTIDNYCVYQDPKNYESNNENNNESNNENLTGATMNGTREQHGSNTFLINKKEKKEKNDNKDIISSSNEEDIVEQSSNDSDPEPQTNDPPKLLKVPYKEIIDLFNTTCTTLPSIIDIKDGRKQTVRVWYAQCKNGIDDINDFFKKVNASDFLSGRSKKWENCNFDWIIKPANRKKILEGNYINKKNTSNNIFDQIGREEGLWE